MNRFLRPAGKRLLVSFLLLAFILGSTQPGLGSLDNAWKMKVDPALLDEAAQGGTDFLIFLGEQADLSGAGLMKTKAEKGRYVFETLKSAAARTQKTILDDLKRRGVEHRAYWVANMIWVRGDARLVQAMAQRQEVAHLYADTPTLIDLPSQTTAALSQSSSGVEWNIAKVEAPQAWAAGYTGQGAVIGGQDTGYDWQHPALKSKYRGWNGAYADHNYNWHDAIHTDNGNICGADSPEPCDDSGHGTHTMGTMVGDDGAGNQVGMAPGAKWIGCRNMEEGWGKPSTYSECYEWFIAPYPLGAPSTTGDPSKAPDVINNSWSCPPAEGCTAVNVLETVVNNVRAAGILTVHSAGNSGPTCSTVSTPAAIYDASFTVGATGDKDIIAGFSSRGPVTVDGSSRLKPDIVAPGDGVHSSLPGGSYGTMSGTSMAAPHVAGLAALLVSFRPLRAGQIDYLENAIKKSAFPLTATQNCGGVPGSQVPNNTYGWGRIDALSAMKLMENDFDLRITAPRSVLAGGEMTYTLTITYLGVTAPTHNVVLTDTLPAGASLARASLPYSLAGSQVRWVFRTLGAGESASVTLVVQAPSTWTYLHNDQYGVRSDEVPTLLGPTVNTRVRMKVEYLIRFSIVFRAQP